jgi:photosystem II stability/assembly factor-like uncharacterized protein
VNQENAMRKMILLLAAILPAAAQTSGWSSINSGLPSLTVGVNSLVIDPSSPSTLYAQTVSTSIVSNSTVTYLFKSDDGAATWQQLGSAASTVAIAVDPRNPSNLYAGTSQGILKSSDRGVTFTDISGNLPVGAVTKIAVDPSNSSALYILNTSPSAASPGSTNIIYKTTDGGATWNALPTGLPDNAYITVLSVAPSSPSTVYAFAPPVFATAVAGPPFAGGLIRSTDGGQTWQMLTLISPNTLISMLVIDPIKSTTLYALTSQGMLKSSDGGDTWNSLSNNLPPGLGPAALSIDPSNPNTLYVALRRFGPEGPSWNIGKSTDGGASWTLSSVTLPSNLGVNTVVVDPATPSQLYLGASAINFPQAANPGGGARGGVFKSVDTGASFQSASNGLISYDVHTLAVAAGSSAIYAGGFGGVSQSLETGASWNLTSLIDYTGSLTADSADPNTLYAETGRSDGCNSSDNLVFSTNNAGANWSASASPLNSGCILNVAFPVSHATAIVVDPSNPNTLYLGESDDGDGYSAILKSTDRGANWIALWDWFDGLRGTVHAIAIDPLHSSTIYAGLEGGLFKTTDGGRTWTNTGFTNRAVTLLAIDPANIYAATASGLSKSVDGGASWTAINAGLESVLSGRATTLTVLTAGPSFYLGTSNAGIYQSTDQGAHWSPLNNGLGNLQIRAIVTAKGTAYTATAVGIFKYGN